MPQQTIGGGQSGSSLGGVIKDTLHPADTSVILGMLVEAGAGYVPVDTSVILGTLAASVTTAKTPTDTSVILGTLTARDTFKTMLDTSVICGTLSTNIFSPSDTSVILGQLRATDNAKILKIWTAKSAPGNQLGKNSK